MRDHAFSQVVSFVAARGGCENVTHSAVRDGPASGAGRMRPDQQWSDPNSHVDQASTMAHQGTVVPKNLTKLREEP
jgi:hypothetical protein